MTCEVNTPLLQTVFPGQSGLTISRFLNASLAPGGTDAFTAARMTSGDNQVWAQLWHQDVEQFYCHASECVQSIMPGNGGNASEWVCTSLQCTCRPGTLFCGQGTINLSTTINGLTGPATVACQGEGKCQFKQSALNGMFGPTGISLDSCSIGECVRQYVVDEAMGISTATGDGGSLSGGVIAGLAVLGAFALLIALTLIWGIIRRSKARKAAGEETLVKRGSGVGVAWSGVGYEVRSQGRGLYGTVIRWLRGTGTLRRKQVSQSEDGSGVGPNGGRVLLRDVCGELPAGGFCAVLGPSGAGKSTLVDILAGKRKTGKVQGKVAYINDLDRHVKVGYCDQSDVLAPTSTVFETLKFAAMLRLPENVPKAAKEERARTVLRQLGLEHIADTRVGSGEHRGISGGEMRRVSIGIELVANPDVLVCDEPTSGLDSVSAARIVALLKSLAEDPEQRTTVIASIHQPSSALYHSFTQVLVLANGRQLYFGPGGNAPAEFFAAQGRVCPPGYNIADHLLEIASDSPESLLSGQAARSHSGSFVNGAHDDEKAAKRDVPHLSSSNEVDLAAASNNAKENKWWPSPRCATTFLTQLEVISAREWRNLRRDKTLLLAHLLVAAVLGVFAGGLYFQVDLTIGGFQNRIGSLFFLGALIAFSSLSALNNLSEARPLFLRERSGSFYSPQAWLLSRVLWDIIPLRIIPTIILGVIVYWMVGLAPTAARFFKFLLILLETQIFFSLYNFLLPSVFTHVGVATLLSSLWNLFNLVYAGFFVNLAKIPPVLRWLHWIAPLSYALEALAVNDVGSGLMIVDTLNGVPINISAEVIQATLFGFKMTAYYRDVLVSLAEEVANGRSYSPSLPVRASCSFALWCSSFVRGGKRCGDVIRCVYLGQFTLVYQFSRVIW